MQTKFNFKPKKDSVVGKNEASEKPEILEEKKDTEVTIKSVPQFFGVLFQARDYAHLTHLRSKTKSFSEHKALDDYYNQILDLTDGLVESYQGIYGLQDISIPGVTSYEPPVDFIRELYDQIDNARSLFKESFLQNEIDEIQKLNAQTLYKLINLK